MNDNNSGNNINNSKEFRYSEGCFHIDKARKSVIAWHNCSIKPVYFSLNEFKRIKNLVTDDWLAS